MMKAALSRDAVAAWKRAVLLDSPSVALPMQETSGTTLFDISGNGRNATLTGTYTLASAGPLGTRAVAFGGGSASIAYASWMNASAITVEMFFTTADLAADRPLASRDGGGSNRPWEIDMSANGRINAYGNNTTGPVKSTTGLGFDNGAWHYFAWGVDSGGAGFHIVDGAVDNTYTGGGAMAQPGSVAINIANNAVGGIGTWPGSIAFFCVFVGAKLATARCLAHRATLIG